MVAPAHEAFNVVEPRASTGRRTRGALVKAEERLAEAQRIAHVGSWEWRAGEEEMTWSDETYRILGHEPRVCLPTRGEYLERVHLDDRRRVREALEEALSMGEPLDIEHRLVHPDGSVRHVHARGEADRDGVGGATRLLGTLLDVTVHKRAEEEMREANRRLTELASLRADFTAMVAHELDTPLAVIRGYADMLSVEGLGPEERDRALARIQAETEVLDALVKDVRTAAAAEREDFAVDPRPVPVDGLLKDAATFARTLPGNRPLIVEDADGRDVWADPYRIGQVLRNLLANAAKFSPEGAPVGLRAVPGDLPGRVRLEVTDRGPGVHPDDVERIFEKFGRGRDPEGRKVAGAGLGLYLSRRILQAHGARLTHRPAPGGGSVFVFELRAAQ